jgi:hypothetical protein
MPEGRGRKAKKPRWQLVLGARQVILGVLGLTWMMMIIFILGVLAGRGDVYRWLSTWGLVTPEAAKVAQWSPPPEAPPATAPAAPPAAPAAPAAVATATPPAAAPPPAASPAPVTGSIAPPPSPAAAPPAKKAAKKGATLREQKAKEEELQKLRREVASKLKFQNSFDSTSTKPARTGQKPKDKTAAASHQGQAHQVRVAQYRDLTAAKAKMAELQKKGDKVALKKGKDNKGVFYDIVREAPSPAPANPQPADAVAQKTQKSSGNKPKKPAGN